MAGASRGVSQEVVDSRAGEISGKLCVGGECQRCHAGLFLSRPQPVWKGSSERTRDVGADLREAATCRRGRGEQRA